MCRKSQDRKRMKMIRYFEGVDYADDRTKLGRCTIGVDTAGIISPVIRIPDGATIEKAAVDCPFGTSDSFVRLYRGELQAGDVKTRATERWLRNTLAAYGSNVCWKANRGQRKPAQYVNCTGHVQPSVGLQIVPGFLDWFYRRLHDASSSADRRRAIRNARLGSHCTVESHPRAFLYSAVERIYNSPVMGNLDWAGILPRIAEYRLDLQFTYAFLRDSAPGWLWNGCTLSRDPGQFLFNEHTFDAFLAALTAFAHAENQTVDWKSAGLSVGVVEVEGHILILKQYDIDR